jgi:hypothetical protein
MRRNLRAGLLLASILAFAQTAQAVPLLQLDMAGGVYDPVTETIIAPNGSFELFALLTPRTNATDAQIEDLLNTVYYISVAITPKVSSPASLGSFEFGTTTVDVTADMTYGTPPLEAFAVLQGQDPHDLPGHGIYDTYFVEFAFQFQATNTALTYNSQDSPGGLTPDASGQTFYASFVGDTSLLAAGYALHFDLYDVYVANCGKFGFPGCEDIDVDHFAPFSHDAGTTTNRVPAPSTGLLMLLFGAGAATVRGYRTWRG